MRKQLLGDFVANERAWGKVAENRRVEKTSSGSFYGVIFRLNENN